MSTTTNRYFDDEMYPVFYVLVFAFYPDLNFDGVIVQWSFCHSLNQLCDVFYMPRDMVSLINPVITQQSKDVAIKVSNQNIK